jgi:hypothetical protein
MLEQVSAGLDSIVQVMSGNSMLGMISSGKSSLSK